MFNDSDYMPPYDQQQSQYSSGPGHFRRNSFDHGSPSSNGGGGGGPESEGGEYASRRSSVSSHQFSPSPRMDVAPLFESMTFQSPHWGTDPLPRDGRTPDLQPKAQSPPRLMMPETQNTEYPAPPTINAPDGDGDTGAGAGPSLHIVPATPVSGGGAGAQGVPFQQTLHTLNQG